MKKLYLINQRVLSILLLTSFISLTALPSYSTPSSPLEIAVIIPLSGKAAPFGNAVKNGLLMSLNEKGRNHDETSSQDKLSLHFYNNKFSTKESVSELKRAIAVQKPHVVISIGATHCNAITPITEKEQIVHLAASSDDRTTKNKNFTIRTWSSGFEEGRALAQNILKRKLLKTAVIITPNDYHLALKEGLLSSLPSQNLAFDKEVPSAETTDFLPILIKAKKLHVDSIGLFLDPGLAARLSKQAHTIDYYPNYLSGVQFESDSEIRASQGALNGGVYITRAYSDKFQQEYKKQFLNTDALSIAALHYDIGALLLSISQIENKSADNIMRSLRNKSLSGGATGDVAIEQSSNEYVLTPSLVVKTVFSQ